MNENDYTKEELLEEINRLKSKLNEYENGSGETEEAGTDLMSGLGMNEESFSDMFSSILSFGGFDLQNIQVDLLLSKQ